jgi:competence protein ComEA
VVRSVLVELAMLATTLSMIAWMGWAGPANRGQNQSSDSAALLDHREDTTAPPSAGRAMAGQSMSPVGRSSPESESTPSQRSASAAGRLDLNQATSQEFDRLPGIGPALARRIIEHRQSRGPFATVDDLLRVKGIGTAKLAALRGLVTVRSVPAREGDKAPL